MIDISTTHFIQLFQDFWLFKLFQAMLEGYTCYGRAMLCKLYRPTYDKHDLLYHKMAHMYH